MEVPGITETCCGYSGGTSAWPTYESIGDHTECVRVRYDPAVLTFPAAMLKFSRYGLLSVAKDS